MTWPANGSENWNDAMKAHVEVSLAADGKVKDGAVFSTSAAPVVDAGVANKKYVDDTGNRWVKFLGRTSNGACTIRASSGVASVTRTGTGKYTLVFTTAWGDDDYVWNGNALKNGSSAFVEGDNAKDESTVQTTTTLYIETTSAGGGQVDVDCVWVSAVGNSA